MYALLLVAVMGQLDQDSFRAFNNNRRAVEALDNVPTKTKTLRGTPVPENATAKDPDWLVSIAMQTAQTAIDNLHDAKGDLADAKKARVHPRAFGVNKKGQTIYRDAEDKRNAIRRAEAEIVECKAILAGESYPNLPLRKPRTGDFGMIAGYADVIQVISPASAIIELQSEIYGMHDLTAWIDTDTSDWTDEERYRLGYPILFVGTKTYQTPLGGTNTVAHVRTLTDAELRRFHELVDENRNALKPRPRDYEGPQAVPMTVR